MKSENALFKKWEVINEDIVTDGIVNEEVWNKSSPKILFIMKEVNDPDGGGWDLREALQKGCRPQTWDNITRWIYGIRNIEEEINWEELIEITVEDRIKYLNEICVVNLKKSPGGNTTNNFHLAEHTYNDRDLLKEQFGLYKDADIIICCGSIVSGLFHDIVNDYEDNEWKMTSRGIYYHAIGNKKYLFKYFHPEARVSDCLLYYGIIDAVREVIVKT